MYLDPDPPGSGRRFVKIIFLIQGFNVAASRYRVLQYLPFLKEAGLRAEAREFPRTTGGWLSLSRSLEKGDTLFVQRTRMPLWALMAVKGRGVRIVYDFDDAVMFKNSLSPNPYSLRRTMSFRRQLKYSDLVIAGNEFLRAEASKYHGDVRVLPTPIDGARYTEKRYERRDEVVIGWIGDHGSIHYMESYRDVWDEVGRRHGNAVLAIICDTFIETARIPLKKIPWSFDREVRDLQSFDIGVMPLFDDLWSRGKCGYKIIQYMGVGVPAVCTPVGINRDVVEDGANGFWAATREEWVEKLARLVGDQGLRLAMGKAGREKIMARFTVQACAPLLTGWLEGLS